MHHKIKCVLHCIYFPEYQVTQQFEVKIYVMDFYINLLRNMKM
jgi:hypothetical protein